MEEIIGFFGFSIGASLAVSAVRTLGNGSQPAVRELFKAGMRAWDGVANAGNAAREGITSMQADARAEQDASRARARRKSQPQKIIIAQE